MFEPEDSTNRSTDNRLSLAGVNRRLRWGAYSLVLAGLLFVVHAVGSLHRTAIRRGYELGVDELDGLTAAELATTYPDVSSYIEHVHMSLAGLMVASGIAIVALAWFGARDRSRWAMATAVAVPVVFAAFTLPIHRTVHFDFDSLVHLGPAGIGSVFVLVGAILVASGFRSMRAGARHGARNAVETR